MNCLNCNNPIPRVKYVRKFCSDTCRAKHWRKNNPDKVAAHHANDKGSKARSLSRYYSKLKNDPAEQERQRQKAKLRKKKLRSLPKDFSLSDWKAALEYFEHKCAYCSKPASKLEQEHFIPVKQGGGYTKTNIIPACPTCNSKKRAKNTIEWLAGLPNALIAYARITHYFNYVKQG